MDINGNDFRRIVLQAIYNVLAEEKQKQQAVRLVYVVFPHSFDGPWHIQQQELAKGDVLTAVIPDDWPQDRVCCLMADSPFSHVIKRTEAASLSLAGSLTIYPAVSHTFAAKAALCMYDTFTTKWFGRCLSEGGQVHLMLHGLQKFTRKEPDAYVQRILSYYKILLTYGVTIGAYPGRQADTKISRISSQPQVALSAVLRSHVITASDVYPYTPGTRIMIAPDAVVTSLAQEEAEHRQISFVRSSY